MKNTVLFIVMIAFGLLSCKSNKVEEETEYYPKEEVSKRGKKDMTEVFNRMDADQDRQVSKSEAKGPLANDFDKIDTDGNGYLSLEEFEKAPKPQRGKRGPRNQ